MTNTGMARLGFRNDEPPVILKCINRLYGIPILQELYQALLRLHDPMDRNQPVKVMLYTTEEVQIFLTAHPYGYHKLSDINLISCAMIKLYNCGSLYNKAIERWQSKTKEDKKI